MLIALAAIVFLCLKVADIQSIGNKSTYQINAAFSNVGGLKPGSPVRVGGVVVGRVADITLNKQTYEPDVKIDILSDYLFVPRVY